MTMATTTNQPPVAPAAPPPGDPAKVVSRVRGVQVIQLDGEFVWTLEVPSAITVAFPGISAAGFRRANRVYVAVDFGAHGLPGGEGEPPLEQRTPMLVIHANFLAQYVLEDGAEFAEDDLQLFARVNGPFTTYPYWREFVDSSLKRMGAPTIQLPQLPFGGRFIADPLASEAQKFLAERIAALPNLPGTLSPTSAVQGL
jgi:hypothetical protein